MFDPYHAKLRMSSSQVNRLCFWIGLALLLAGYGMVSMSPDSDGMAMFDQVFLGMNCIAIGAAVWLGAIFFKR